MRKEYLLRGDSLVFNNGFEVHQPTVETVMEITYGNYMWFVECLCSNIADMIVPLWGKGIDFEDIEENELFKILVGEDGNEFCNILKHFSNLDEASITIEEDKLYIYCKLDKIEFLIGDEGLSQIKDFFSKINLIQHSKMRKFAGQKTKKSFLDEDYEELLEKAKEAKNINSFGNSLSDLVVLNKRSWEYVYGLTIARLNEELNKTYRNKKINLTLHGIYSGVIDGNKTPSSDLELNI